MFVRPGRRVPSPACEAARGIGGLEALLGCPWPLPRRLSGIVTAAFPPRSCISKIASTARAWRTSALVRARRSPVSGPSPTFLSGAVRSGSCPPSAGRRRPSNMPRTFSGTTLRTISATRTRKAIRAVRHNPAPDQATDNPTPCPWRGRAKRWGQGDPGPNACSNERHEPFGSGHPLQVADHARIIELTPWPIRPSDGVCPISIAA